MKKKPNEALDTIQSELIKSLQIVQTSELSDATTTGYNFHILKAMKAFEEVLIWWKNRFLWHLIKRTTGFNEGDLIIIAAHSSMGKTALVLNMAFKNEQGKRCNIFHSLEMPAEQLMLRMLSAKTRTSSQNLLEKVI